MGEPSEPPPSLPKVSVWSYFNKPAARVSYIIGIALIGWWRYEASQPEVQVRPPVRVIDVPPGALLGRRPPEPDWDSAPPADAEIDPARLRVTSGAAAEPSCTASSSPTRSTAGRRTVTESLRTA